MSDKKGVAGFGNLLYGGDYNPEQWLQYPEILEKNLAYMKAARINAVSLGIFAWSSLEAEEGSYDFTWMEEMIGRLWQQGISVFLSTPSGSRPKWLAERYPEVLRVDSSRHRDLYGLRHNHCYTSPVYREKVGLINTELAKRFGGHPGVLAWHISNEYGGECHCPLCQEAFRSWLKERYGTIEKLNQCWYTTFWSHTYQSFEQIESPSPRGEQSLHALNLDWHRFVTDRTVDFARHEIQALRTAGSDKPVTTNMMYHYEGLNYYKFAGLIDFACWDSYPTWHQEAEALTALDTALQHDLMRSIKKQPFILMESCPAATNWQSVSKLKRPGMLAAASLQAVAHGSDGVLYFQLRQSRGSYEKFHGAVIDHYGGMDTRVFGEVTQVGAELKLLNEVCGANVRAKAAVLYDWENRWAMENAAGPRNKNLYYKETVQKSYSALKRYGLDVDVIDMEQPLTGYQVVAVPMLYMFRAGFEQKVRDFVAGGGMLFMTYWSGIVDETDLCFLGGTPHGLMDVMGLRSEELDSLYDGQCNEAIVTGGNELGLSDRYQCEHFCDVVRVSTARPLMVFDRDFYAGRPALTVNAYGDGTAYYIGGDMEQRFYDELYAGALAAGQITPVLPGVKLPEGVFASSRSKGSDTYLFIQNFSSREVSIPLPEHTAVLLGNADGRIASLGTTVLRTKQ